MAQFNDRRGEYRELQKAPVLVQKLNDIYLYSAIMVNFSDKGVYLETDAALDVGTDIIIGIEDSTFISLAASPDSPKFYYAKIMWQKTLSGAFFNFSFGTKFVYFNDKQNAPVANSLLEQEYRKHPRKYCSKPVFLTSTNQYYEGLISNISRGGAFIETPDQFQMGQKLELVLPRTNKDKCFMIRGKVLHLGKNGIGVCFKSIIKEQPKTKN